MNEREKYELMWSKPTYRTGSGGVNHLSHFLSLAKLKPNARIIDFGCGQGKAGLKIANMGMTPILVDIAENCLDPNIAERIGKCFIRHDLTTPLNVQADAGFCVDAMEHFPSQSIGVVLDNIFAAVPKCYFAISTQPDGCGKIIGERLHLSVYPHKWWKQKLSSSGRKVVFSGNRGANALFFVTREHEA